MRYIYRPVITLVALAMLFWGHRAFAQWSTNPSIDNAVYLAPDEGFSPAICSDDSGGAIITWSDFRNGTDRDIYAQRINSAGVVQWTSGGVAICTATGGQLSPTIVSDGSGGAIITWEDFRNGTDYNIYAQKINSSGVVQWATNGVPIDTTSGGQTSPTLVSDGAGGAIITWMDSRIGTNINIYAQRVNSSGVVQWTTNGIPIDTITGFQEFPTIVSDGNGGAIITWYDNRSGNYDIYTQRVSASGSVEWTTNGVAVCTAINTQDYPTITGDGSGGAIITWEDYRNGADYDIYAQHVNSNGAAQWRSNGVAVCASPGNQTRPVIVSDGSGGAIITWDDLRNGTDLDVYAQRITSAGMPEWTANGAAICTSPGDQFQPTITGDGSGGAVITWYDNRSGTGQYDIYAQGVNLAGVIQWTTNGVAVCTAANVQDYPTITGDGSGGAIITWEDSRGGVGSDIYALRLDHYGHPFGENPAISGAKDVANDQGGRIRVLWTASTLDTSPDTTVRSYTVRMGVTSVGLVGKNSPAFKAGQAGNATSDTIYWWISDTVAANGSDAYAVLVPTEADSGPQGIPWYYFQVVANYSDKSSYWPSNIDSGYSVDNLPPGAPAGLTARVSKDTVGLAWEPVSAPDLWGYDIYRSSSSLLNASFKSLTPYATTTLPAYIDASPLASNPSYYIVLARDIHGNLSAASNQVSIALTGVKSEGGVPKNYALMQNYPNPFNPTTIISYQLPSASRVTLKVYDVLGREVATLANGDQNAGSYAVTFDGTALPSGVYFYKIVATGENGKEYESVRKLLLVK